MSKKWVFYYSKTFNNGINSLDKSVQKRIKKWIDSHLVNANEPRDYGKPLVGNLKGYWRYRIGDYRLLAKIEDNKLIIIMVNIGHRRKVYK